MLLNNYKFSLLAIYAMSLICFSCKEPEAKQIHNSKPNIVFIFADDLAFNAVNYMSNETIFTPNLDKLSETSTNFTHTFNMGGWNGAVCIASRTMLFTGKYIWNAYKADSLMQSKKYKTPLLSELLEEAGYDTYMSGKWHIQKPAKEVFETAVHIRPGMPNQTDSGYNRPLNEQDTLWRPWDRSKDGFWKGGKHWSEVLADDATEFLEEASTSEAPFFMYLAFNAPHDPRQSPKEYVDMYPVDSVKVPNNFLQEYPYSEEMGSGRDLRDEMLAPFPRTPYSVKVNRQEYYALISHMDHQIGKIMDALKASGKMENTYIIFSADHGLSVGQHGLLGKQNMYNHSMRIPLLISGPEIPEKQRINTDIYVQDIMPTILELAGIEIPEFVDFQSLKPLIDKNSYEPYSAIYGAYTMTQRMIIYNGYKLIVYPKAGVVRLFNLATDPHEMRDLSVDNKYVAKKQQMLLNLLDLQKEMNDPLRLEDNLIN